MYLSLFVEYLLNNNRSVSVYVSDTVLNSFISFFFHCQQGDHLAQCHHSCQPFHHHPPFYLLGQKLRWGVVERVREGYLQAHFNACEAAFPPPHRWGVRAQTWILRHGNVCTQPAVPPLFFFN